MELFIGDNHKNNIARALLAFLVILTIFFVVKTVNEIWQDDASGSFGPNVITVSGQGEAVAIPDVSTFTFSVQEKAESVTSAQETATKKINDILDYLEEEGIEERDVKTLSYNVYPRYEYRRAESFPPGPSRQVLIGYEVSQRIEIKVRDTSMAGDLLTAIGERGVSNISGLSFTVDDEGVLKDEARKKAIDDAREKAEKLADDLGVRLGKIISYDESGNRYPIAYRGLETADGFTLDSVSEAPQIPTGENTITSNVSITYEIK